MKVFVSYQRRDALWPAHLLGYALRAASHEAFVDTGDIDGGAPFREVIAQSIAQANVVVALVGEGFDTARLHEPANVIAFEWLRARFHGLPVVPALVDRPGMPADADLPTENIWSTTKYLDHTPKLFEKLRDRFGFDLHFLHDVHHRLTPIEAAAHLLEEINVKIRMLESA